MVKELETPFEVEAVRKRLKTLELSQAQFAAIIRMDASALSRALSGKRKFHLDEKKEIVRALAELETSVAMKNLPSRAEIGSLRHNRAENLKLELARQGMRTSELSERTGVAKPLIDVYRTGDIEIPDEHAEAFSEALGASLDAPYPPLSVPVQDRVMEPSGGQWSGGIPLFGPPTVIGDGRFKFNDTVVGSMADLALVRNGEGAYCIYSPEWGGEPRFEAGQIIVVLPRRPVSVGGWVAVYTVGDVLMLGRMRQSDSSELVLSDLPGGGTVSIPRGDVVKVHMLGGLWFG